MFTPDGDHRPSDLHRRLLALPWADIFSTNWDTLLEMACPNAHERAYDVVTTLSQLPSAALPRIIKLHGTLPANGPFICTPAPIRDPTPVHSYLHGTWSTAGDQRLSPGAGSGSPIAYLRAPVAGIALIQIKATPNRPCEGCVDTEGKPPMPLTNQKTWIQVWDPLVRYGHWALVASFATAYLSAENESGGPDQIRIWSGYNVGILVAVRVVWGLVGTRHARFRDFAYSPAAALKYLADLLRSRGRRYVGHSPAATYMIAALLLCLAATVGTGIVAYGDVGKGPLMSASLLGIAEAHADDHQGHSGGEGGRGREGGAGIVGDIHGALATITLGLVVLHILGVGLASVVHRENLVGAMLNGRKRSEDER